MRDPNELVLVYDGFKTKVPTNKKVLEGLTTFFEDHGLSPNDWFAWDGGVDIFEPKMLTWKDGKEIIYSYLTESFIAQPTVFMPDPDEMVRRHVAPNRTKYYVRTEDVEVWVSCPDEDVYISNRGRVKDSHKRNVLKIHKGGKVSGPWVRAAGKRLFVRDLMRKYIYAVPGMV